MGAPQINPGKSKRTIVFIAAMVVCAFLSVAFYKEWLRLGSGPQIGTLLFRNFDVAGTTLYQVSSLGYSFAIEGSSAPYRNGEQMLSIGRFDGTAKVENDAGVVVTLHYFKSDYSGVSKMIAPDAVRIENKLLIDKNFIDGATKDSQGAVEVLVYGNMFQVEVLIENPEKWSAGDEASLIVR